MFYEEGNALSGLEDTHNAFWWVTLNVNMTLFVYKKAPQGTFNLGLIGVKGKGASTALLLPHQDLSWCSQGSNQQSFSHKLTSLKFSPQPQIITKHGNPKGDDMDVESKACLPPTESGNAASVHELPCLTHNEFTVLQI